MFRRFRLEILLQVLSGFFEFGKTLLFIQFSYSSCSRTWRQVLMSIGFCILYSICCRAPPFDWLSNLAVNSLTGNPASGFPCAQAEQKIAKKPGALS
jgi:hypothetical protein